MTNNDFQDLINNLREQTFHMTDEEATPVVDVFLKEHPELLDEKKREWFIKYC
jgi:hypothetical protein